MKELIARIQESQSRIGKMCSELRPPKMRIPATPDDDDTFICDTLRQCRDALEKMSGDAERLAELDKANVDLAAESSKLCGLLSDLVDAVDAMEDLDEMDGEEFSTNSAKLDAAVEAARPHTEAALLAASQRELEAIDEARKGER